jgi:hypothetical protein
VNQEPIWGIHEKIEAENLFVLSHYKSSRCCLIDLENRVMYACRLFQPSGAFQATTGYFYVVCIYGETLLCSNGLWCDISPKSCRYIALIRYKFILQTTEIYFYKCRNNASFRICLLYTSTIFIVVVDTFRFIMGDTSTLLNRIKVSFFFWLLFRPTLCD